MDPEPLFEREDFRRIAGQALRPGGTALTSLALEHCFLAPGALVADVGCGRGASLDLLTGRGFRPIGLDPSPRLLAEARQQGVTAWLVRGAAEAVPLRDGTFAAVLCECVLSVTRDPDAALAEMRRILAPGGLLLMTDLYLRDPVDVPAARVADTVLDCSGLGSAHLHCLLPDAGRGARPSGCAAGAVPRAQVEERLRRAGFSVRVFEDHSRLLAELAGRLLFAGFDRQGLGIGCSGGGRPGYFLCIAQAEAP